MRYDTRYRSRSSQFFSSVPPGVRWLVAINVAVFLIDFFASLFNVGGGFFGILALRPLDVLHGYVWQPVTYLFLHSLGFPFFHILFNMLALWMFGSPVEQTWGTRRFLQYYFICGVGAGACVVLGNLLFGNTAQATIGASGAIFGLLLAYGMLFPEQQVIFFIFPVKAKYLVLIYGVIELLGAFQPGGAVSYIAHLGGMLIGYIYMKTQFGTRRKVAVAAGPSFNLLQWWKDYKLQRARKKFKVYMKKHGSDGNPRVN
jgi:membrane associated rhomboid family serine protease